jgi:two-component system response regulator HydG
MSDQTQWLKSPVSEKLDQLTIHSEIKIAPYFGSKRKVQLRRTSYVIGSGIDCDIVLQDPFTSKRHALLELQSGGGFFIQDLDSKNGIFLNGIRVKKAILSNEGQLRVGRSLITWCQAAAEIADSDLPADWIVADPCMKQLLRELKLMARSSLPIMILGGTGSGKEVLAQLVHNWSGRSGGPFVPLNGGNAEGSLIESELFGHLKGAFTGAETNRAGALVAAHNGTLYVDEIGDVPLSTQLRLLRAFESGEVKALGSDKVNLVDVRLVSATSINLEEKISNGSFRLDFYYRVAGHILHIPLLKDRPLDILAITKQLLKKRGLLLAQECEPKLLSHPWPGNVRELRNVIERASVLARSAHCDLVLSEHILLSPVRPVSRDVEQAQTLEQIETDIIRRSLDRTGWSRTIVAKELGIARSTLFHKMKKYGFTDKAPIQ